MASRALQLSTLLAAAHLAIVAPASGAGICDTALQDARDSKQTYAEDRPFPLVCNWNYIFALERQMIRLGDLDHKRAADAYHEQIDREAIKRAQRRVQLPETGVADPRLFVLYMSLEN